MPSKKICPRFLSVKPINILNKVDFPELAFPKTNNNSPFCTPNERSANKLESLTFLPILLNDRKAAI